MHSIGSPASALAADLRVQPGGRVFVGCCTWCLRKPLRPTGRVCAMYVYRQTRRQRPSRAHRDRACALSGGCVRVTNGRVSTGSGVATPSSDRPGPGERRHGLCAIDTWLNLTVACYVIADGGTGASTEPHIVIDLHPDRTGPATRPAGTPAASLAICRSSPLASPSCCISCWRSTALTPTCPARTTAMLTTIDRPTPRSALFAAVEDAGAIRPSGGLGFALARPIGADLVGRPSR